MTELRLTTSATVSSSDGGPLVLSEVRLLAGDGGTARADLEDGHGMPILGLRAGPAEPSPATGTWRDKSGRTITGLGVHLSQGAVLIVEVEPAPDPARVRTPHLVQVDGPPRERTYRTPPELNDSSTATLRRPR